MLNPKYVSRTKFIERHEIIVRHLPTNDLKRFLLSGHSYGMIYDMVKRDYPVMLQELKNISKKEFNRVLKANGYKFDLAVYNARTNDFKLQYLFPKGTNMQEVSERMARQGQKAAVRKRRVDKRPWFRGVFNRENSPLCKEFYLKRGIPENEGELLRNEYCRAGALAALQTVQAPMTEKEVAYVLVKLNVFFYPQYRLQHQGFTYFYDFFLPDHALVIECHGDYWHANPAVYKEDDVIKFPGSVVVKALDVWRKDWRKKQAAKAHGFDVHVIWEDQIKSGKGLANLGDVLGKHRIN